LRWLALIAGAALVALAFAAATRVADTREGLVAEIVTLLGGMAGTVLLIYGLATRRRESPTPSAARRLDHHQSPRPHSRRDLLLGAGGIGLAAVLLIGLALSGGFWWALIGALLLLPMVSGSVYLLIRFVRAAKRTRDQSLSDRISPTR
jgi:Flp pilus assembly protein TadB